MLERRYLELVAEKRRRSEVASRRCPAKSGLSWPRTRYLKGIGGAESEKRFMLVNYQG